MSEEEADYDDFQDSAGVRHGRWTSDEHHLFIQAINQFGREWDKVQSVVKTRSLAQIRSHAQKYFLKLSRSEEMERIYEEGLWSLAEGGQSSHTIDALTVLDFMTNVLEKMKVKRQRIAEDSDATGSSSASSASHPSEDTGDGGGGGISDGSY